jgi:hypothetical protein
MAVNFTRYNFVFLLFLIIINCSYSLSDSIKNVKHLASTAIKDKTAHDELVNSEMKEELKSNQEFNQEKKTKNALRNNINKIKEDSKEKILNAKNVTDNNYNNPQIKNSKDTEINQYVNNTLHKQSEITPPIQEKHHNNNDSVLELETKVNYVDKKFGVSFIQSKIDPSHLNPKGNYLISLKATEAHRLSRFIWAIIIVIVLSIGCYFIVKFSVDWVILLVI